MALVLADRVKETTTTTGTADFVLSGADTGFQTFAAGVGANNTTYYAVALGSDFEIGLGTLSANGLTLARTTVLQSSNSDTKVSFAAGSKFVFVTYPADKAVLTDATQTLTNKTLNSPTFVTPVLGTPSSGTATNLTGLPLSTGVTGTLSVSNGGTSLTTLTANNVLLGNGTSAPTFVAPSTAGNVLTSTGTTWSSTAPSAGGITYTTVKTANYTAANNDGVQTNTTAGAFTVTLPATPSNGNQVIVVDSFNTWGTNNLTIGRNGSTIEGVAEDLVCDITGVSVQCVYNGTTWDIFAQVGGAGGSVVSGPASSTDNAIARFDGTTGKIIQNSVVTIADTTGNVSGVGALSTTGVISAVISGGTANPGNSFWFSDNSASAMIYARQNGAGDLFALSAGATEQFRVTAAGVAQVASGVKFPATQSASADANTLDDYEEGTFTVTTNGDGTGAFSAQTGEYTKIGNICIVRIIFSVSTNFTSPGIGGLPFTVAGSSSVSNTGFIGSVITSSSNESPVTAQAETSSTSVYLFVGSNNGNAHEPNTTNATYRLSIVYRTA
jgi:hypothetical protein